MEVLPPSPFSARDGLSRLPAASHVSVATAVTSQRGRASIYLPVASPQAASSKVKKICIYTSTAPYDFRQIKTDRHAFVSINRMRAGHTTLKASLKRLSIMSTAECECGDGLKTEEHIFQDSCVKHAAPIATKCGPSTFRAN